MSVDESEGGFGEVDREWAREEEVEEEERRSTARVLCGKQREEK